MSSENFSDLLEESLSKIKMHTGAVVHATVVSIGKDRVVVSAGLKSEGMIPIEEFHSPAGELEVNIGDDVEVTVEAVEDGYGETILSREKAKRMQEWRRLEEACESKETVLGTIVDKVKGGFTVGIGQIRAFLPGSLVDVRPVRDSTHLEGKELEFKVIKMDPKRNNIVVSRRAVVEEESGAEREALLESLQEGMEIDGIVKNLTDYGAFIDLGGIDGLLHITDLSWKRVRHPSELLSVGQEVRVKILNYDREKNRVSLGMKQLSGDPWMDVVQRYKEGDRLKGGVTNVTDYGCFVEIEEGIEGLVHMSEMDWTNKNIHPNKVVQVGDEVDVMVLEIDDDRRRVSLGIKQCLENPWDQFATTHEKGEKVGGKIRSITDFGVFIGLDGGIDGLVHTSDLSWDIPGEEAVKTYTKGDEVKAVILAIDPSKERISLGIKQLEQDGFSEYAEAHPKGSVVTGKVVEIAAKQAVLQLSEDVQAVLRAADFGAAPIEDMNTVLEMDQELPVRVTQVDKRNRKLSVSIKTEQSSAGAEQSMEKATLGDLLKEKMDAQPTDSEETEE